MAIYTYAGQANRSVVNMVGEGASSNTLLVTATAQQHIRVVGAQFCIDSVSSGAVAVGIFLTPGNLVSSALVITSLRDGASQSPWYPLDITLPAGVDLKLSAINATGSPTFAGTVLYEMIG